MNGLRQISSAHYDRKLISLSGKRFGRLTVLSRVANKNRGKARWLCKCQCGKTVEVDGYHLRAKNIVSCGCYRKQRPTMYRGEKSWNWKNGIISSEGYRKIKVWDHPNASKHNHYVGEHTLVMENKLKRHLYKDELVHHKNGIRSDNREENLELWVKSHPKGQRLSDMIEFCYNFLSRYAPSLIKEKQ